MHDALLQLPVSLAARPAHAVAGWRGSQSVSCASLAQRVQDWCVMLDAQPGCQFALYFEDSLEFAAALLGAWQAGKTVWLTADALPASCAALSTRVDGFLGEFPEDCAALTAPARAVTAGAAPAMRVLDGAFEALVVHTSGSTGAPQAIPKRLSQMSSEVDVLEAMFGDMLGADAAVAATVSHQHIYGLLFKVLWPLCAGRPVVADSVAYPEELAALLAERPSLLVSSPAHLKRLPQLAGWQDARAQLRAVFSSGGPLPEDAAFACADLLGKAPVEVYGSSETGGVAWRQRTRADSVAWAAFPNVEWRLEEEGALAVRSAHLADDNWLQLADRAEATDDGRFELRGRADRIVKLEEKRISLDALEAALRASPLVGEARLMLDDSAARSCLAAFVVLSVEGRAQLQAAGKLALNRSLRALLAASAEAVALPRRWRYLDQLPVNAQGKTTHAALAALLVEQAGLVRAEAGRPTGPEWRELERGDASVKLSLTVPKDLLYFEGHFPGSPILPGVVQVDWAIARGRHYFEMPPVFRDIAMLKFQQVIAPGATVQLELAWDSAKSSMQFKYLSDAGQHASGRIVFAAA
jgi:acyl-coenzyme A synthetase/AMP-(fatty) acid ligase/3-hydroxymyristoyl/3-hydroxydecanoyl-(acyl carrier protein) dehydratase